MKIHPSVFREYDIRGVAGEKFSQEEIAIYEKWYGLFPGITLTLDAAHAIGKAYGTIIRRNGGKKVVVGYEIRPGAEQLKAAFISGILQTGCYVLDAGVSLTPVIYFATAFFQFDGGVNITGSHNIYFYNGFKLMKKDVWPLYGEELQEMRAMIEKEDFLRKEGGKLESIDIMKEYREYFLSHITLKRPLRIVIDSGNGSAGPSAPKLFRELGCEVLELYSEPNATFPNHIPDPSDPHEMRDLMDAVKKEGADMGIGFDADGDRVGFVTEKGECIDSDLILLLFAKDILSRHPGKTILHDVKTSQLLGELIPRYGGIPLMHRTGHAPIKDTMRRNPDVMFAGEQSGHYFFVEDYFKIDDGLFAAGKMAELLSRQSGPFSSLFADIPGRIRTPELRLPCSDEVKFQIMKIITKDLQGKYPVVAIDGVRIQVTKTGWGIIRSSNTAPYLTVRVEGESKEEVLLLKGILADELEKFPEIQDTLDRFHVATHQGKLGWI